MGGLECLLNVIRALRMGSCFSGESGTPRSGSPMAHLKRRGSKRRYGSRNSSFDYRREEQLHRIPGRMFLNGSSDIASLYSQQGKKGTNQDAMIVWEVSFFSLDLNIRYFMLHVSLFFIYRNVSQFLFAAWAASLVINVSYSIFY